MLCKTILLDESKPDVKLDTYVLRQESDMVVAPRDAIVVLPGGGYSFLSEREGEPIARGFLQAGFNAFVLYYSINENAKFPGPLQELSMAVAHIRRHAAEYNVDPARIFVTGCSAGGHLAASLGVFWDEPFAAFPGMAPGENRPAGMILSYPVATLLDSTHGGSRDRVLGRSEGEPVDEALALRYSPAENVSEKTVPAFIWQTESDGCVPVENAMRIATAMISRRIPTELHIFPKGNHGIALATEETCSGYPVHVNPHVAHWLPLAIEWCRQLETK